MPSIKGRITDRRLLAPIALILPREGAREYRSDAALFNVEDHRTIALFDTGATSTCITRTAIQRLGLQSVGKRMIGNANSDEIHDTFTFRVAFYLPATAEQDERLWHIDRTIAGADIKPNPAFEVLLGMDVIELGDLSVHDTGSLPSSCPDNWLANFTASRELAAVTPAHLVHGDPAHLPPVPAIARTGGVRVGELTHWPSALSASRGERRRRVSLTILPNRL